jgi:2-methylfumaryl-CoA hydratase
VAVIKRTTGNFLEDFEVGSLLRHKGGRTVTSGIHAHLTDFCYTTNPLHKNERYARRYGFDGMILPPGIAMIVAFSQTVEDISENARANLEYIDMRFGTPVHIGDTIEVESTVLGVRVSSRNPDRGVVHVQTIARNQNGAVVIAYQRKVQVYKKDPGAHVEGGEIESVAVDVEAALPPYDPNAGYGEMAHLTNSNTYFEDFRPGDVIEHSRGRVMTDEHIWLTGMLDNTSQVHCNQTMIDRDPRRFLGGKLIVFGGIPFNLCLGLSCPDIADNSLYDLVYTTGRHTAPVFAGDTVFASTEIQEVRDLPGRDDLGVLRVILRGQKFDRSGGEEKQIEIFYLERELAVKRRSHYC